MYGLSTQCDAIVQLLHIPLKSVDLCLAASMALEEISAP